MKTGGASHRLSRDEAAAETRELLLASAREVFVERGYHAASIYEVAERAGRTIGALYSHFGGKEGVFLALADRHFAEQLERYSEELSALDNETDPLTVGGRFWNRFLDQEPELVVLFIEFWSYAMRDPDLRPRFAESLRRLRAALAKLVEDQQRGSGVSIAASPTEVAILLDALIDGFALHKLADPEQVPDSLLPRALGWLVRGMVADGGSTPRKPKRAGRRDARPTGQSENR